MKGFIEWFRPNARIKRWIFLILVGIILACYGISTIIVSEELEIAQLLLIILSFIVGFTCIVLGIVFMQKRTMEMLIESTDSRVKNNRKHININSLIFNKKIYSEGPKIVVIGSGNGIETVVRGLKQYTDNITAVVTVSSYGNMKKENINSMPIEDIKNTVIALARDEELASKLMSYKYKSGDLKDVSFSDLYFATMQDLSKDFTEAIANSNEIFNIIGRVLPITNDEMRICAELENGMIIEEKDEIKKVVYDKITKINRVFISPPNCRATPEVVQAIKEADCIVIGPGSLYTNVIPNLLVNGVYKAMKDSKAIKIYVSNIMTEPGQTDYYTLSDHIKAIIEHTGKNVIDYCIYDTGEIIPEYIKRYNLKGSELVAQDVAKARTLGVRLLQRDLACIENGYIRHNPDLVAKAISELICDDLKYRDKQSDPQYMLLKSKLEYEKQFNKIKNKPKKKRKTNENKKGRKSKFLSKYGKRIEAMRNTEEVKLKNREILQNENKNVLFAVLGIIVLVVLVIGVFYHFRDRRTYTLNLPQLEKLESISLNQNEKDISINGREEMKDILYVLNGTKRVTKNESIQDAPVNIDDEIKVDFHFIEAGVSTIFVYKKNNSYYIEQPYNGIYQISGDEYNSIEKLVR